jgi:hypothetical protein
MTTRKDSEIKDKKLGIPILGFLQKKFDHFLEKLDEDQKKLFTSSTQLFLFLAVSLYLNKKNTRSETLSAIFTFLGGPYLMSSLTETPIENFKSSLIPFTPQFIVQDRNKKIFKYQKKYDKLEDTFPESVQKRISKFLESLEISRKIILEEHTYDAEREQECITKTLKVLDFLFFLFGKSKKNEKINPKNIIEKLDIIVNNYGKAVSSELRTKVFKPIIGSMLLEDSSKKLPVNPVYLCGDPGVGKTRFIVQLAKILDIPIVHYEPQPKRGDDDWVSKYCYGREFDEKHLHPFTTLLHLMKKDNKEFGIFFIDELDKYFSEKDPNNDLSIFLLKLLNPDKTSVEDPYLSIEFPTKNILLVCTGNKKLSDISEELVSLESRFVKIKFPSIPQELKLDIALENAKTFFDRSLTDLERSDIKELVENDKDPDTDKTRSGVRQLIMDVQFYFRETQNKQFFENTNWSS